MLYDLHQLFFDRGSDGIPVWGKKVAGDLTLAQVLTELGKKADLKEWEVHVASTKGLPVKAADFVRRHKGANLEHATIAPTKFKWQVLLGGRRLGDFDDLDLALRHGIEETKKVLPNKPVFVTPDGDDWSIRALIPEVNPEGHECATIYKVPA